MINYYHLIKRDKIILLILLIFCIIQYWTIDYGNKINGIEYIKSYNLQIDKLNKSYLERKSIAVKEDFSDENYQKWMLRFKIYSIEADEPLILMALSRIKPKLFKFDPGLYQYGGAFLYPLGGFYFLGMESGLLPKMAIDSLSKSPEDINKIYLFGRVFVLICFCLSAYLLYLILRKINNNQYEILLLICIYMVVPSSIMFSQIIKPHWYSLLWINISLYIICKLLIEKKFSKKMIFLLSLSLGFLVGSSSILSIFAIFIWIILVYSVKKKYTTIFSLIYVPILSLTFYLLANPFVLLNLKGALLESKALADWYQININPIYIWYFLKNSIFLGFGLFFSFFLITIASVQIYKPKMALLRWYSISLLIIIIIVAYLTSSLSRWHTNTRYIPYILSSAILFIAMIPLKRKIILLVSIFILTILQSIPLKIAYFDENNFYHSTRISSAVWINSNISPGENICLGTKTLTPYDTPPFEFIKYNINGINCTYQVIVEREADYSKTPDGFKLVKRFYPRLSSSIFPFVYSHINPQISIYKNDK